MGGAAQPALVRPAVRGAAPGPRSWPGRDRARWPLRAGGPVDTHAGRRL